VQQRHSEEIAAGQHERTNTGGVAAEKKAGFDRHGIDRVRAAFVWASPEEPSLRRGRGAAQHRCMPKRNPFLYFETRPEIRRMAVMLSVRCPLSLHAVEDRRQDRLIEVCREAVRNRAGALFARLSAPVSIRHEAAPAAIPSRDLVAQIDGGDSLRDS
jgi:putative transposase